MMEFTCGNCDKQLLCEAQNKVDLNRINDIKIAIESFDYKGALDLINIHKISLIKRNARITDRE